MGEVAALNRRTEVRVRVRERERVHVHVRVICMHVYMYICTYTHTHTHTHTRTHTQEAVSKCLTDVEHLQSKHTQVKETYYTCKRDLLYM